MRWGSPTATPPFEPLDFAHKEMLKDILPFLELNGQFDKLTDRTEGTPVPEPVEGPLSKPHIYTVAYASGSERCVFLPWLLLLLILPSVSMLLSFPCHSVANLLLPLMLPSVFFRVNPWLVFCLFFLPCNSVANSSAFYASSLKPESI